jgi:diguanylate cyclase (GGDEF)-like protein
VRINSESNLEGLPGPPYARELHQRFARLRFAPAVEGEFTTSQLRRTRGRVRAWHTIVLVVLGLLVLPGLLATSVGGDTSALFGAWNPANNEPLLLALIANTLGRVALVILAWGPWFERLYPRFALPLIALCHASWTFACSGEIVGSHPEYLAPLVTDAFAAYFFSGLLFRQALAVNLVAATGLLFGGWYYAGVLAPILSYGMHLFINMIMGAIAAFAHERSVRSQFLEHALLGEMAARDGLTGLKNRRAFDEHLTRVWQQALRDRRAMAILMIDVDEFKHYNDCYGHQAGDQALKRIAEVVNGLTRRPLDFAARYGGEELAIILYEPSREDAADIAEQLLTTVRALAIEHRESAAGIVTVSIGVAVVRPTLRRSPQGALQLSDEALYIAKGDGRNRISILEDEYGLLTTGAFRTVLAG